MFSDIRIKPHSWVSEPGSQSAVAFTGAPVLTPAIVLCLGHISAPSPELNFCPVSSL